MANYTDITAEVIADFRDEMSAFSDDTEYPESVVLKALYRADMYTGGRVAGAFSLDPRNAKREGLYLYAAHWISVTYLGGSASDPSNISPSARLNVAAKSVGDESVTYRVGAIQETEKDWLSLSDYGVQFLRWMSRVGKGARAV